LEKVPFLRGTPAQIFNFFQILRKIQAMGGAKVDFATYRSCNICPVFEAIEETIN